MHMLPLGLKCFTAGCLRTMNLASVSSLNLHMFSISVELHSCLEGSWEAHSFVILATLHPVQGSNADGRAEKNW